MNTHISNYLKIGIALIVAFIVTSISTSTLFYPASPRLNPQFLANISKLFQKNHPKGDRPLDENSFDELKNLPLTAMKKVSQGVYAKEEPTLNTTFVRITNDARFEIKEFTINEKKINILVPKQ